MTKQEALEALKKLGRRNCVYVGVVLTPEDVNYFYMTKIEAGYQIKRQDENAEIRAHIADNGDLYLA